MKFYWDQPNDIMSTYALPKKSALKIHTC